ncbi:hypothetical protein FDENT_10167 [Fusarium denticulatum]|uniref:Uncharacterized protein n=1 Tax=Fusarium denticulatum TaxID=48507 RepID=A0A8H5WSL5_9HYPO|nr:hypothetical protein FDENT_10167 [Fusarium denticulatum]
MIRLGWLLWALACLPSPIASTSRTYLEQSIQDLNITDPEEVKLFVQEWTRPSAIKRLEFAPLASQLPTWDLPLDAPILPLNAAAPKLMGGAVLITGLVAEQIPEATAALRDRVAAELLKIQVGELVALLMRRAAILQSGSHLATVTETTTSWATKTDTETVTTDGTTTAKTVSTIETTVFVTVSRGPTGDEATGEDTPTDSDRKHKRLFPAAPHKHPDREAPTKTKTEWTTKYSTSITTHKQTVTVFVQGQSTFTVGPTGTAASSSESGSGNGGPPKGIIIGAARPSQFYAANNEAPATAQKPPPPFMSSPPTPAGARDTWAPSPSRSDYSQPPAYPSPMPELGNTQFAYEMHTSPQRSPQELYHPQYMSGLGLPEMRDQRRG